MDVLESVFNTLIADQEIANQATGKIKYYEFPDSMTMDVGPYIIIDPLDVPIPNVFADDKRLMYNALFQVETWSKSRSLTREIAARIESLLWDAGFRQVGGLDEYDSGVFRDARRYRKTIYSDDFILRELELRDDLRIYSVIQSIVTAALNKMTTLTAIVQEKTTVEIAKTEPTPVFLSVFVQANTKTTGIIGNFSLLTGEIISDSFMNSGLKRNRIANFITESQTKTNGNFEIIGKIDLTVFSVIQTSSQADLEIKGNKRLAAVILAQTSKTGTIETQSFENLAAVILAQSSIEAATEIRSFNYLGAEILAQSSSAMTMEIRSFNYLSIWLNHRARNDNPLALQSSRILSEAAMEIRSYKNVAAEILAQSSSTMTMEIRSFENVAAEILAKPSSAMTMEIQSFKNLIGSISSDSVSHAEIDIVIPVKLIHWVEGFNVNIAEDGTITKTGGGAAWNAGAQSLEQSDGSTDFIIEYIPQSTDVRICFGLDEVADGIEAYRNKDIDFNWEINPGGVNEVGINELKRYEGTYSAGDVFRVALENGVIRFYQNGEVKFENPDSIDFPIVADVAIHGEGMTFQGRTYLKKRRSILCHLMTF